MSIANWHGKNKRYNGTAPRDSLPEPANIAIQFPWKAVKIPGLQQAIIRNALCRYPFHDL
jgi:hypothetical protein